MEIEVRGQRVEVVRKDIRNLHVAVYPPSGRVRVAAPQRLADDAIRLAVISRIGWIRRRQTHFARQERQSERAMVTGESHYVQGRRYLLDVVERDGPTTVKLRNRRTLELGVRPGTGARDRKMLLDAWYRAQLRAQLTALLAEWEPIVGVTLSAWGIKRMKTRWGTCNTAARRIWLNLELAKKPAGCAGYVLFHELVHLIQRRHDDQFAAHMDRFMPQWRTYRDELNRLPLAHEDWEY